MTVIKLFRLLMGYITFRASGGFSERFINLCASNGIDIRNIEVVGNVITADTKIKNYKKLRHAARKSGMKMTAVKKRGLPFFICRHKDRVGLVVGAVFFVVFMSITSLFIWNIETVGAQNISGEEILQTVSELGLKKGALASRVDETEIVRLAMMKMSGKLSWMAVNIKGSHAVVEVRDYEKRRDDETYGDPCNIVADFDGLILSMEIYNGAKANYEGGGVRKGDLLISGIIENRDTSSQFLEARGEIVALHNDVLKSKTAAAEQCRTYTKVKSVKILSVFSLKIPLGFLPGDEAFDEYTTEKCLTYGETELPFGVITKTRAYYTEQSAAYGCRQAVAYDNYTAEAYEKYKNTLITSSKIDVISDKDSITVSGDNECIDFMGVKQEIEITG